MMAAVQVLNPEWPLRGKITVGRHLSYPLDGNFTAMAL